MGRSSNTSRQLLRIAVVCTIVNLALLATVSQAAASSGEITRAEASPDWTTANVAGMIEWTKECEWVEDGLWWWWTGETLRRECRWEPYVTIGPGDGGEDCLAPGRTLGQLGEGVRILWTGAKRTGSGVAGFELTDAPLADGASAPLVCLSAHVIREDETCTEWDCHVQMSYGVSQLGSALLRAPAIAALSPTVAPPASGEVPPLVTVEQTVSPRRPKRCGGPSGKARKRVEPTGHRRRHGHRKRCKPRHSRRTDANN